MSFSELFTGPALDFLIRGFSFLYVTAWVWLPIFLVALFWRMWIAYIQSKNIAGKEWIMLEVRLPKDILRSPATMELFFNALHNKGSIGDPLAKYWKGNITPWTSLEVASIEGSIHFFIRTEKGGQKVVESQIYSQYPDAEILEADDYTERFIYNEDLHSMGGGEMTLTKPDPFPIKTYIDYGLDKNPKEELKIDPMTPMIEWLGSLGKGEQAWIQMIVRFHLGDNRQKKGVWFKKEDAWQEEAKEEIAKIKEKATTTDDEGKTKVEMTSVQKDAITALEKSVTKPGFDVGIRAIYIAEQDVFNRANIGGLFGSFKSYGSGSLNGFKPGRKPGFTYPWQDPRGKREARQKKELFDAYRRRGYFHPPHKRKPFVLNTEELATIYHFPGGIATTPTFKRIASRKSEPPTDIPV